MRKNIFRKCIGEYRCKFALCYSLQASNDSRDAARVASDPPKAWKPVPTVLFRIQRIDIVLLN